MKGLICDGIRQEVYLMAVTLGKVTPSYTAKTCEADDTCRKHLATQGSDKSCLDRYPSRDGEENKINGLPNVWWKNLK
jgi:hypothetical protein